MVDENLRNEMSKAYSEGKKDEALELSRKLDKQILKSYQQNRPQRNPKRTIKNVTSKN